MLDAQQVDIRRFAQEKSRHPPPSLVDSAIIRVWDGRTGRPLTLVDETWGTMIVNDTPIVVGFSLPQHLVTEGH